MSVHMVRIRLLRSFVPRRPSQMNASPDLYGPSMVVLTMVALLLFNMKSSGYVVQNGTLMGTSFFTCFGSWLALSGVLYVLCFLLGAEISMLELVSVFLEFVVFRVRFEWVSSSACMRESHHTA
ncbi:Yip1 domain protein [Ancylostoma duodenale]|uniref:Yip1 domain protein n=1 Tax=Ancylostoma duodenale TaxID=51022 RepID=A0A0C2GN14_9BILA|nr:Yip1 domain protein [Ancylostoma duodenale]